MRYLQALAGFPSPELLGRSLELTFSGEVRSQDAPYLLMGILGRREGCAAAWEAIETALGRHAGPLATQHGPPHVGRRCQLWWQAATAWPPEQWPGWMPIPWPGENAR